MRVLMSATASPAAMATAESLERSGHHVERCHEEGDRGLVCSVLRGRSCPLDGDIDVAVVIRDRASFDPEPLEDGVVCAIRQHIPLVVGGVTAGDPFAGWAVEVEGAVDPHRVEQAAAAPLPDLSQAATEALRRWLDLSWSATPYDRVEVFRRHGGLVARVVGQEMDRASRDTAAVRVHQALRAADRFCRRIDVTFGPV